MSDFKGTISFDQSQLVGGLDNIVKISQISVFAGSFQFNFVVTQIDVTYVLANGSTSVQSHGGGGGILGSALQGSFSIPDGVYLARVEQRVGLFVDWLSFCSSDGRCSARMGGGVSFEPQIVLEQSNSAIEALIRRESEVLDRLGVYYEGCLAYARSVSAFFGLVYWIWPG